MGRAFDKRARPLVAQEGETSMAFLSTDARIGTQPIGETSSTQQMPLGAVVTAADTLLGEGEFVYLAGVDGTVAGDVVVYNQHAGTTTRALAGARGPAAVAMSANVTGWFGWYQVSGAAAVRAATVASGAVVYATAAPGVVDDVVVAGDRLDGARLRSADGTPAAGFAVVALTRPALNGNG